jgi:hypothetical protein
MAASALTVTKLLAGISGTSFSGTAVPTLSAANVDGNYFAIGRADAMVIWIKNTNASDRTMTVVRQSVGSEGLKTNMAITVSQNEEFFVPIDGSFRDSNGRCNVTYDAVTDVTVAVLEIPAGAAQQ